jgi:hypothetical protein
MGNTNKIIIYLVHMAQGALDLSERAVLSKHMRIAKRQSIRAKVEFKRALVAEQAEIRPKSGRSHSATAFLDQ